MKGGKSTPSFHEPGSQYDECGQCEDGAKCIIKGQSGHGNISLPQSHSRPRLELTQPVTAMKHPVHVILKCETAEKGGIDGHAAFVPE